MKRSAHSSFSPDLSRLFAAAVVSPDFCQSLLRDAATALASGYCGESFALSQAEEALVLSIEASSLAEFASQVVDGRTEPVRSTQQPAAAPARGTYDNGIAFSAFHGL